MVPLMLILLVAADLCSASVGMTTSQTSRPITSTPATSEAPTTPNSATTQARATTQTTIISTDPPLPSEGVMELIFNLNQGFTGELADPTTQAYKILVSQVLQELNRIGKKLYGARYLRAIVLRFRRGSVVVESNLVFTDPNSVPDSTAAKRELSTELTSSSSLDVVSGSVNTHSTASSLIFTTLQAGTAMSPAVTSEPQTLATNATSQAIPTTAAPTTAAPTTAAPTTAAPTTAAPTTAATQTTTLATDPPSNDEGSVDLLFSLNETFSAALSNSSSAEHKALAAEVLAELNRIGSTLYDNIYLRSLINSFTNGSVVVNSTLVFTNQSVVPSTTTIQSDFETNLRNSTLNFINGTASAFSTTTTSSAPHNTMGSLIVFSVIILALLNMMM